jgi:hypothetical protein
MGADVNKYNFVLDYVFLNVPDDIMETRGYWEIKVEALDRTLWTTHFEGGCGPSVR